jgi:thioredoxin 1
MQARSADPHDWVICLCAEWCGVCREWRKAFDSVAAAHPDVHFAWVDVEDEADAMGDVDVETFPSLLVAVAGRPMFFGPVLPAAGQFERLVQTVRAPGASPTGITPDVNELFPRLAALLRN